MKKTFLIQKILFVFYILAVLITFAYALGFMTDYHNLFGFEYVQNKGILDFHDNRLQVFNQKIFNYSLFSVVSILVLFVFELNKKVADLLASILTGIFAVIGIISSVFALSEIPKIKKEYFQVDFSNGYLERLFKEGESYVHVTRTFDLSIYVYTFFIVACLAFASIVIYNHVKFIKLQKAGDFNE